MNYRAGDEVRVKYPPTATDTGRIVTGKVKFVKYGTGWIYFYCTGKNRCGWCGPGFGEGAHRVGMSGSTLA